MIALVSLYVYIKNTSQFTNRSMELIMKDMGHNYNLISKDCKKIDSYLINNNQVYFPISQSDLLLKERKMPSKYYVAMQQERLVVQNTEIILSGIKPLGGNFESPEKRNLLDAVKRNEVRLGADIAKSLNLKTSDTINIEGKTFKVATIIPYNGDIDDYRVWANIEDTWEVLGNKDSINILLAFLCMHGTNLENLLVQQQILLKATTPNLQQIIKMPIAKGRDKARQSTNKTLINLFYIISLITIIVISVTGLYEVHERRREIGIMLSMGTSYLKIIAVFLIRILLLAIIASIIGFFIGSFLSIWITSSFLETNTQNISIIWSDFPTALGLTSLFAIIAQLIPVIKMLSLDPVRILVED